MIGRHILIGDDSTAGIWRDGLDRLPGVRKHISADNDVVTPVT
jgi:hypothetical protein